MNVDHVILPIVEGRKRLLPNERACMDPPLCSLVLGVVVPSHSVPLDSAQALRAGDFLSRIQVPHGHGAHEFYHVAGFSCGSSFERLYRNDEDGHAISLYSPSTTTGCATCPLPLGVVEGQSITPMHLTPRDLCQHSATPANPKCSGPLWLQISLVHTVSSVLSPTDVCRPTRSSFFYWLPFRPSPPCLFYSP